MSKKRFAGRVALDVRNSQADWSAYEPPKAPEGAPNVLYIVWDDVGFGSFDCYGGLIETPNMSRLAGMGLRYSQFHTTAVCSPYARVPADRTERDVDGMACVTEFATGYPAANGRIPFENAMISQALEIAATARTRSANGT